MPHYYFFILSSLVLFAACDGWRKSDKYVEPMVHRPLIKMRNVSEAEKLDAVLDFVGLVERHGYSAEEHIAVTEDGYNLRVHRIPPPAGRHYEVPLKKPPPVLLQHGVLSSADSWVLMGPPNDLPFVLADAGYDVWLGNARGNTYSRSHKSLQPESPQFWNFSFHEIGTRDLPAMIDYILTNTEESSLCYIGHSMGTTVSYVLLSQRPEYNVKLNLLVSLAPVALWKHRPTAVERFLVKNGPALHDIARSARVHQVFPQSRELPEWAATFCQAPKNPCELILSQLAGEERLMNMTLLPRVLAYYPAGGSAKTLAHYQQNIKTGKFRQYDEGPYGNMNAYGQLTPPSYDLAKITAPVAVIYASNDPITTRKDSKALSKLLPNLVTWEPVPHPKFNHVDFQWGNDSKRLVHDRIVRLMALYGA